MTARLIKRTLHRAVEHAQKLIVKKHMQHCAAIDGAIIQTLSTHHKDYCLNYYRSIIKGGDGLTTLVYTGHFKKVHGYVLQQYRICTAFMGVGQGGNATFTSFPDTVFAVPSIHCDAALPEMVPQPSSNPYGYFSSSLPLLLGGPKVTAMFKLASVPVLHKRQSN